MTTKTLRNVFSWYGSQKADLCQTSSEITTLALIVPRLKEVEEGGYWITLRPSICLHGSNNSKNFGWNWKAFLDLLFDLVYIRRKITLSVLTPRNHLRGGRPLWCMPAITFNYRISKILVYTKRVIQQKSTLLEMVFFSILFTDGKGTNRKTGVLGVYPLKIIN